MTDESTSGEIASGDLVVPSDADVSYRVYCVEPETVYFRGPSGTFAAARHGVERDLETGKLKRYPRKV